LSPNGTSFLFWKESGVRRWAVTNIKRGGKMRVKTKEKKTCPNNFGLNQLNHLV
jgi:hypothetical protein